MSTSAKLVTSQFIKSIPNGGKTISIEWAKQTTAWNRLLCAPELQNEFAAVVESSSSRCERHESLAWSVVEKRVSDWAVSLIEVAEIMGAFR